MKHFAVRGMKCGACSVRVKKAVSAVDGVKSCCVDLATKSMSVDGTATPEAIIAAVKEAGYDASLTKED